jgi:DNA-binding beta-propeller fold protein YncE
MKHAMPPATCSPTWAQPSADGKKIYVACNKANEILEIDRDGWSVTRRLTTGRGPYNLAVTPDGRLLLATLKPAASFEIFDLAAGKSLGQFKNSTNVANGIAVTPDSRYAFVSSEGVGAAPGKVDVYDLRALAKVGTVDVGQQAGGIAFWKMQAATP